MQNETKAEQLITKLIRETFEEKVIWTIKESPNGLIEGTDNLVPLYLMTTYKGKYLGVYQKRFKIFIDEIDYTWNESIGFCITDFYNKVVWEFEDRSPALYELFNTAREQASGIGSLIDDLLDD